MSTWVFNFKAQFADKVERGHKRQTVRATRKDRRRPSIGDTVHCYTGLRSKNTRLLCAGSVIDVASVVIEWLFCHEQPSIWLNGVRFSERSADEFAHADGFESFAEMAKWFREQHGSKFHGFVTYWE